LDEAIAEYKECIKIEKSDGRPPNSDYLSHWGLGVTLAEKGRLEEAIAELEVAVKVNPEFAAANISLGVALVKKGRFAEALGYLRRGHELGSKDPSWTFPSAQCVQYCERFVELESKLPAILSGQQQPADIAEHLALAEFCQLPCKKRYAAASRFYREAFAAEPKLAGEQPSEPRYNAACAAALAGCGQGKDADKLDTNERTCLRRQALDWLRADLKAWRQVLDKSPDKAGPALAQQMKHWLQDADFAGVRGPDALARLPEAERSPWQKLWDDVAQMLAKAQGKTPAEKKPDAK
jgi:serine/threonine-protein kinase